MSVTRRVAECLLRLKHDPGFQPFMDWLKEEREAARDQCEGLESAMLHRAQGKAKALGELLKQIEDAPKLLERLMSTPSSRP